MLTKEQLTTNIHGALEHLREVSGACYSELGNVEFAAALSHMGMGRYSWASTFLRACYALRYGNENEAAAAIEAAVEFYISTGGQWQGHQYEVAQG